MGKQGPRIDSFCFKSPKSHKGLESIWLAKFKLISSSNFASMGENLNKKKSIDFNKNAVTLEKNSAINIKSKIYSHQE